MKNNKKILSILAGLALSGTLAIGAAGLTACNGNYGKNVTSDDHRNTVKLDTAAGVVDSELSGTKYYVAPDGLLTNTGLSQDSPKDIVSLLGDDNTPLKAGDTVYVIPGVYSINGTVTMRVMGEYNKFIRILNAAYFKEESGYTGSEEKVTLSFYNQSFASTSRGVQLYSNYTYWYGIDVAGAGDNGFYIGGSFNTVEYGEYYDNRDSGLQLGRQESTHNAMTQWPSFNLVKNCTSHNNYDNETFGENADGFAAKLTIGFGNVFDGCIAYRNSDDGWDLYAKSDSGNIGAVIIYNCVAFENGYLEYDRDTCNAMYPTFDKTKVDVIANKYATRDGDGNGFKLGGSVMEGDVVMYNCLSFQNRMHGVTDNSNPGYLKVEGVTSYDNSAAVDPESGEVKYIANGDTHGNIDVARQTYSYNTVKGVLSVKSAYAKSVAKDAYRGSIFNSLLNADTKTNVINGAIDADTNSDGVADFTSQIDALNPSNVFGKLPVNYTAAANDVPESYDYVINGALNSGSMADRGTSYDKLGAGRVHKTYRNASDKSINMQGLLEIKADFNYKEHLTELQQDEIFGASLSKAAWGEYKHFVTTDIMANPASSADAAVVSKVIETLTINTEEDGVYQDFEVPITMQGAKITWTSDDPDHLAIGTEVENSISGSQYITLQITRDATEDKTVKLTAKVEYGSAPAQTKDFNLVIKKGAPSIGEIRVITVNGKVMKNGAEIVDQYDTWREPSIQVLNGLYYSERVLDPSEYTYETTYMYAENSNAYPVQVSCFTPSVAGVYTITHTVTVGTESKSMTYSIFVASPTADVDISGSAQVSVNKDGYVIGGNMSSATGILYTVASPTQLTDLTAENIKTYNGVQTYEFRATSILKTFSHVNNDAYYVYYAIGNLNGEITSEVKEVSIGKVEISTPADFATVAGGGKVGNEDPATTIYVLKNDIDFSSTAYTIPTESFKGLLNGQGKSVKNITIDSAETKSLGLFKTVKGGTIMNIKFENIKLTGNEVVGIVANSEGGNYYNIAMKNIYVSGSQRVAALIGRATQGAIPTTIDQVSLINPIGTVNADGSITPPAEATGFVNTEYFIASSGTRAAGILGFVQCKPEEMVYDQIVRISNCYVESYITAAGYSCAGICAEYNENGCAQTGYELSITIDRCISKCVLTGTGSSSRIAGMLGYHASALVECTITHCLSLDTMYYAKKLVDVAQKNISGMVGNYQTSTVVEDCISLIEEHNSNADVSVYLDDQLARLPEFFAGDTERGILALDLETRWSYKYVEGNEGNLASPYVTLNFLGDWD